jgi:hypothetical protein
MQATRVAAVILAAAVGAACRGATFEPPKQARDPLLERLKEPPLNVPMKAPPRTRQETPRPPALPPGDQPGIFVFSDGRPLTRALTVSGRVALKSGVVEFVPETGTAVQVLYRLPQKLDQVPALTGTGSLTYVDRSSPAGPAKRVILSVDGLPLLAEVWQKSPGPITLELGTGLELRQTPGSAEGVHDVPVEIVLRQEAQPLSAGVVTTVKTASGMLRAFVQASYVANVPDPTGQYVGGYILHAWIARATP